MVSLETEGNREYSGFEHICERCNIEAAKMHFALWFSADIISKIFYTVFNI